MQEQNDTPKNESPPADALSSLLEKIINSATADNNTLSQKQNDTSNNPNGDILSSIISNPEILSKLPQMLSVIKPILESVSANASNTRQADVQSADSTPAVVYTKPNTRPPMQDNRTALLNAMKPYLGAERREAIDYIVKLGKLGEILKSL